MIYFATVHWKRKEWILIQLKYIKKHTPEPFMVYCLSTGINIDDYSDNFLYIEDTDIKSHPVKLDLLTEKIKKIGNDDDILIFIDGDAFPIADYVTFIRKKIEKHKLVAVRRDENYGEIYPHPCFCATTIGFWKKINGTWKRDEYKKKKGYLISNPGVKLFYILRELGINWYPMMRTNKKNYHSVYFGIYENMIYHHGAGFRFSSSLNERKLFIYFSNFFKNKSILINKLLRVIDHYYRLYKGYKNKKKIRKIFNKILTDDEFHKIFQK